VFSRRGRSGGDEGAKAGPIASELEKRGPPPAFMDESGPRVTWIWRMQAGPERARAAVSFRGRPAARPRQLGQRGTGGLASPPLSSGAASDLHRRAHHVGLRSHQTPCINLQRGLQPAAAAEKQEPPGRISFVLQQSDPRASFALRSSILEAAE